MWREEKEHQKSGLPNRVTLSSSFRAASRKQQQQAASPVPRCPQSAQGAERPSILQRDKSRMAWTGTERVSCATSRTSKQTRNRGSLLPSLPLLPLSSSPSPLCRVCDARTDPFSARAAPLNPSRARAPRSRSTLAPFTSPEPLPPLRRRPMGRALRPAAFLLPPLHLHLQQPRQPTRPTPSSVPPAERPVLPKASSAPSVDSSLFDPDHA